MNKIIKHIFLSLLFITLIGSCNDEPVYYTLETPPDQMQIKASTEKVTLLEANKTQEGIKFTWNKAADRGEGTEITYHFRMYHADTKDLQSELIKLDEETYSITFSVRELNNLLHAWRIDPGEEVPIVAEVIATVEGGSEYQKPEISNTTFTAIGYDPSNKLYLTVQTGGYRQYLVMNMIDEEIYSWEGELDLSDFWFVRNMDRGVPAFMKGSDENTLVYSESGEGEHWSTQTYGLYKITVNLNELSLTMEVTPIDRLFLVMVDAAGEKQNLPMSARGENVYSWQGELEEGEFWFTRNMTTGVPAYTKGDDDNTLAYSDSGDGEYWTVERYGSYNIIVDLNELSVTMDITPINRLFLVTSKNGVENIFVMNEIEPMSDTYYIETEGGLGGTQFRFVRNPKATWPAYVKGASENMLELKEDGSEMFTFSHEKRRYMITVNINDLSLFFIDVEYIPATGNLGIVGDAIVDSQWDAGAAIRNCPLTPKDLLNQPHIWSYTGQFQCIQGNENQFKFVGDDGWGHTIFAPSQDANPFDPNQQLGSLINDGDAKWKLPDGTPSGTYRVEINFHTFKINLVQQ